MSQTEPLRINAQIAPALVRRAVPAEQPDPARLRPAETALFAIIREQVGGCPAQTADLQSDIERLIEHARRNKVLPLLEHWLRQADLDALPASVRSSALSALRENRLWSLALLDECVRILRLFAADGIQAFNLKGPLLAQTLYGDVARREIGDIDFMVSPDCVEKAKSILLSSGYRQIRRKSYAGSCQPYKKAHCDYGFYHEAHGFLVELHWQTMRRRCPFGDGAAELWKRLAPYEIAGFRTKSLAPDFLLLYLALHGEKHRWRRLLWVCDVACLLRRMNEHELENALAAAHRFGLRQPVRRALLLAHGLLGAPLPRCLADELPADSALCASAAVCVGRMLAGRWAPLPSPRRWRDCLAMLGAASARMPFWRYWAAVAEPGLDEKLLLGLPPWLSNAAAYFIRPFLYLRRRITGDI